MLFTILRFPLGLIIAAMSIQWLAKPYMQWAANWQLHTFSESLNAISPSVASHLGAGVWIPAAGLLLAVGAGLLLATLVLSLAAGAIGLLGEALSRRRG